MSQASYYKGLTIEPDLFHQSLRIEGQLIDIEKQGNLFVYKKNRKIRNKSLYQLAIKIIESWKKFQAKRKKIRAEHLKKLNDAIKHGIELWNQWRRDNPGIRPLLYDANLIGKTLSTERVPIDLSNANLIEAKLMRAHLNWANFHEANLGHADLSGADLTKAHFCRTDLYRTILSGADLTKANLQGAQIALTEFAKFDGKETKISDCKVYGSSAWDMKNLDKASQKNLEIVYKIEGGNKEYTLNVDDLAMAQFLYFILNNKNLSNVFNATNSSVVLILGRFTKERKKVLEKIRERLRDTSIKSIKKKYVPILFDFDNTKSQSLLETVLTLAGMARFIIADVTSATMVREELTSIVEKYPSKPIQPILLDTEKEYVSLSQKRKSYKNILETYFYKDEADVVSSLTDRIITPAERWLQNKENGEPKSSKEIELEEENKELRKRLSAI